MLTFIKPDFSFSDERGFLVQLCHDGWKQINVIGTVAGTTRGGHYHKENREAFFIIDGQIDIKLEISGNIKKLTVNKGDFFIIEKNVYHSFYYTKDTITIALYDIGIENTDGSKDIYTR